MFSYQDVGTIISDKTIPLWKLKAERGSVYFGSVSPTQKRSLIFFFLRSQIKLKVQVRTKMAAHSDAAAWFSTKKNKQKKHSKQVLDFLLVLTFLKTSAREDGLNTGPEQKLDQLQTRTQDQGRN